MKSLLVRDLTRAIGACVVCFLVLTAPRLVAANNSGPKTPSGSGPSSIAILETAINDAIIASGDREVELDAKLAATAKRLEALVRIPGLDPKKPFRDSVSQSTLDDFNLLNGQIRYLRFAIYGEVLKRREFRAILSLVEAEKGFDRLYTDMIASGTTPTDATKMNQQLSDGLDKQGLADWNNALTALVQLQEISDARSIPLKGLLPRIEFAKSYGPSSLSDDLGFLMEDNLKDTAAYKIFIERLETETNKGDRDAAEILKYLSEEPSPTK